MVPGKVIGHVPHKVFRNHRFHVKGKFHTVIFQRTDILQHLCIEVCTHRNLHTVQQIVCFTVIPVHITTDTSVKESEIQSGIISSSLLPLQIRIEGIGTRSMIICVSKRILCIIVTHHIQRHVGKIRTYILLSGNTPSQSELQVGQEIDIFQEVFFLHLPSQSQRGESTPAVSVSKTGRTIPAHGEGKQITV